jgi:hypothetical protein
MKCMIRSKSQSNFYIIATYPMILEFYTIATYLVWPDADSSSGSVAWSLRT